MHFNDKNFCTSFNNSIFAIEIPSIMPNKYLFIKSLAIVLTFCGVAFAQAPTVTAVSPTNVTYRSTMTITGTNFVTGTTNVLFYQSGTSGATVAALSTTVVSATQISVVVPAVIASGSAAGTRYFAVSKSGSTTTAAVAYTYTPPALTPGVSTVDRIITNYNNYWSSTTASPSTTLPDIQHSLMAFRYNGTLYSTGNDAEITNVLSNSGTGAYTAGNWRAIPINNIGGTTPTAANAAGSAIYLVLGGKIDGTLSATVPTAPTVTGLTARDVLIDGTRGLGLGTGITNLPSTSPLTFEAGNIIAGKATDAIPDVLVTQIASPTSSSFTTYCFVDASGNIVGKPVEINMSAVNRVGTYYSDFFTLSYAQSYNTAVLNGAGNPGGNTRDIRVLAYKLSDFGIDDTNRSTVTHFKVLPNGTDDMAFMAYNRDTFTIPAPEISTQPVSKAVCPNGTTIFSIALTSTASGTETPVYQWQKNNIAIANGTTAGGSVISGANTASLTISGITASDYGIYRCLVTNSTGAALSNGAYLNTILVSSTASETLTCQNTAVTLNINAEGNSPKYQWYTNTTSSTTGGTAISGATTETYNPPVNAGAVGTKYYYATASPTGFDCAAVTTPIMAVTVYATPVAGTVTPSQSICSGNAATLTLTGYTGNIQWQSSSDNTTFTNIASATTASLNTGVLTATKYYRAVVNSGSCATVYSAVSTVTVVANAVGGSLPSVIPMCADTTPADIVLTSYTGSVVRWEKSSTSNFASVTNIASTSTTLSGALIGRVNATTYIRALVQSGNCGSVYSTVAQLKISNTVWNGTSWSNGIPTITDAVTFTGNFTAAANVNACTITVSNGAQVNFPTGFTATVNGYVHVDSGAVLTFQDNAALVQLTDAVNVGNIVLHKKGNALYRLDYTLWSSPVAGQNLLAFSPATATNRFYSYKTETDVYAVLPPATNSFETGKAYLVRMPNGDSATGYNGGTTAIQFDGTFTGVPNNGTINIPLSTQGTGYNGVGNPYPSPINIADFFAANSSVLNLTNGIYMWRKKNDYTVSSYATVSLAGYVANPVAGGGSDQREYFSGNSANWTIAQGQGFMVKTSANTGTPNLVFTNSMRRTMSSASQVFFRQAASTASKLWLNISNGANSASQTAVAYIDDATTGMDYGFDAQRFPDNSNIALYSVADNNNLVIQARPTFTATDLVKLGYIAPATGTFTISIDHTEGVFQQGQEIFLKDNVEGVIRNITNSNYTFSSEAGTFDNRFEIAYTVTTLGTDKNPVLTANDVVVFKQNKAIMINSGDVMMNGVTIYDIQGRKVYSRNGINENNTSISDLTAENQVLIIEISTEKGKVSKRIVY